MPSPLFEGPATLRHPRERLAFVLTLVFALPIAYAIGTVIHEKIGPPEVALFIVIAMLYVTLARGRLIGSSVMVHEAQYPRVFALVQRICTQLEIPMPLVFVREDNNVPAVALGFGEPYSLVLSSHWIETFEDDELAFAIGRELGHIAAGHTRFLSLLSVNGNENALVSLVFGGWLRTCTFTCDRIGLLACGSLDAAIRSIAIASFHEFGRRVDTSQFIEQGREIATDSVLRWGEWLGSEPYATRRIAAMDAFLHSPLYAPAAAWYDREIRTAPMPAAIAGSLVTRSDCAGWWRRTWAVTIDLIVVSTLILAFTNQASSGGAPKTTTTTTTKSSASHGSGDSTTVVFAPIRLDGNGFHFDGADTPIGRALSRVSGIVGNLTIDVTALYLWLLVGLAGQSFGMMIVGLRIVTTDYRQPGLVRSFARYALGLALWPLILVLSPFMHRIMLHDRLSGTRLIRAERIMARAANAVTPVPTKAV